MMRLITKRRLCKLCLFHVVAIFGIAGSCHQEELYNMSLNDIAKSSYHSADHKQIQK